MLLIVSLILIGIMCSMRIVSLHMIEREKDRRTIRILSKM